MKTISKKLVVSLFLFTLIYTSLRAIKLAIFKYQNLVLKDLSWRKFIVEYYIIDFIIMFLLSFMILALTKRMIYRNYTKPALVFAHILFSLITWVAAYLIYYFYLFVSRSYDFKNFNFTKELYAMIDYSDRHFMFYFIIVFIIYSYYYFNKLNRIELQKAQLKEQLSRVKVNILKYQLHPHFFFNTLNSISSLIETDTKLAQNTLADFSDLLRDILFLKDTNLMPLHVEMKILKRYIDIMTIRFSDHLQVKMDIQENLDNVLIPSLILQPIIENSIKHGYSYRSTDLIIRISIHDIKSRLHIIISNNGEPLKENIKYSNGLLNTIDRLKTLYHDQYVFELKNDTKTNTVITRIVIPLKKDSSKKDH